MRNQVLMAAFPILGQELAARHQAGVHGLLLGQQLEQRIVLLLYVQVQQVFLGCGKWDHN